MTLTLDAATDNPEFFWDANVNRYRYKDTKRFVPEQAIAALTQKRIELAKKDLDTLATLLEKDKITLRTWQIETAETLKILHAQQYMLGKGGRKRMAKSDYLAIARELKNQYNNHLRQFAQDIKAGIMSPAQFRNRVSMYAEASEVSKFQGEKAIAVDAEFTHGYRVFGIAHEHCGDCIAYVGMGLVPIEQVILPKTRCECRYRCKCQIIYTKEGKRRE